MDWRATEQYLSIEYLDGDTAELLDIVNAELPFERVRDGNVTAWLLRAEHARVITASDRFQLVATTRATSASSNAV